MSHFTVAVFSHSPEDIEELLEPFNECPVNPEHVELIPADESMDDIRAMYEQEKREGESFEAFVSRYYGYAYNEELDECGYLCNPYAKWDWYQLGGRWSDSLKLKPGCTGNCGERSWTNESFPPRDGYCDQARLKDVDFAMDQDAYNAAARFWEIVVEGQPLRDGETAEQFRPWFTREYYLSQFGDKDTYARDMASFSPWAFVTPDGEWHENGEMGWFGANNANADSRRKFEDTLRKTLLEADPNVWISIVDCHI